MLRRFLTHPEAYPTHRHPAATFAVSPIHSPRFSTSFVSIYSSFAMSVSLRVLLETLFVSRGNKKKGKTLLKGKTRALSGFCVYLFFYVLPLLDGLAESELILVNQEHPRLWARPGKKKHPRPCMQQKQLAGAEILLRNIVRRSSSLHGLFAQNKNYVPVD